jgi:uncharacterized protein YukE
MKKRDNFNNSQKTFIWNRQKGRCGSCGADLSDEVDIEYHHVLNCKDGGVAIVENGVMLCEACHLHCHDNDFTKPISIFRSEFKYANWEENRYYKGRKKSKEVEFTKATLNKFDKIGESMERDSYEYHLKLIEDFENKLDGLKKYLDSISQQYQKQINAMGSAGFFTNHINTLQSRYLTFKTKIDNLQALIDKHKQKISLDEEDLNNLINRARG